MGLESRIVASKIFPSKKFPGHLTFLIRICKLFALTNVQEILRNRESTSNAHCGNECTPVTAQIRPKLNSSSADPETVAQVPLEQAFHRVMRAVMQEDDPIAELDALPLAQLRLLWTVNFTPEATMKDFSERLNVSQSTVTQLADRLVRRGLVERQTDASDRRVVRLHVSAAGAAILRRAQDRQKRLFAAVWEGLDPPAQQAVLLGLETLGKAVEAHRAAMGKPLPEWREPAPTPGHPVEKDESGGTQPVMDLMMRRVRGKQPDGG